MANPLGPRTLGRDRFFMKKRLLHPLFLMIVLILL